MITLHNDVHAIAKYLVISLLIVGCKSTAPLVSPNSNTNSSKDILIFIDGTSNTPEDNTNVNKLRRLAKVSDTLDTFYTVGVGGGNDFKISGMAFGVGVKRDVVEAYDFLMKRYKKERGDKIHLFGFSRGAFTCQVLTDFIYTAGMVELEKGIDSVKQIRLIKKMYSAYRGNITHTERQRKVEKVIEKWENDNNQKIIRIPNITIEVLGLFDNVEALAAPDYKEKFCNPNDSHLNQFVNVNKVFHAVALDDNRAQIFTPILASCNNIKLRRNKILDDVVKEVWFAGAHSDVGGGYTDNPEISYLSLDWMVSELKDYNLFDEVSLTDKNIKGEIHDSEKGFLGFFYKRRNRDIPLYLIENGENYNNGKINIHSSVIKRLELGLLPNFKKLKKDPLDWFDKEPFKKCFDSIGNRRIYKEPCDVINVVD
ncbi:DUF2235 domain-containing protein [uncultured Winogradskyella sp.]|uniref:phospholipase effector Tle1 domain-containing protein n=1 Tax=uncultured Winogradskyella sp. TaxID=395353 RepID=UPI0026304299|nr:DUF2235 domain-containing protein [uncultured Winogradskyella sp.]